MTHFILLPGIHGSGHTHWQSFWEREHSNMRRFQPPSWDKPDLEQWVETLDQAVADAERPCVLVAHSLACLLVAHWNQKTRITVQCALLVSVPDPSSAAFPEDALGFANVPEGRLKFPSLVVASTSDPFGTIDHMRERARQWGSEFVVAGDLGHINDNSNLRDWPQGLRLLNDFTATLQRDEQYQV